jgi:hypothetical protein
MSDQCEHCDIRGIDRNKCIKATESGYVCSIPESWYAQQLLAALAEKDREIAYNQGCYDDAVGEHCLEEQDLRKQIAALTARIRNLCTMSTVEMMCENERVRQHVIEWENRCLNAEARIKELEGVLEHIARLPDSYPISAILKLAKAALKE